VLITGLGVITTGLMYLGIVGLTLPYTVGMLPAMIVIGFGVALSFPAASILAIDGVESHHHGVTAGLLTTFQNIGGAIGLAMATAFAVVPAADRHVDPARGMFLSAAFIITGGLAGYLVCLGTNKSSTVKIQESRRTHAH